MSYNEQEMIVIFVVQSTFFFIYKTYLSLTLTLDAALAFPAYLMMELLNSRRERKLRSIS
jgi:hypothetical protein